MRLNHVRLASADLARARAFYEGLGLRAIVAETDGEGALRYLRLRFPDGDGTLSLELDPDAAGRRLGAERAPDPDLVLCFECDALDARVAELTAGGYVFASPPETKPWRWREARLHDPDGHELCLFQAGRYRLDPPWRLRESVEEDDAGADADGGADGQTILRPTAVKDGLGAGPFLSLGSSALPDAFLAENNLDYAEVGIPTARDVQIERYLERVFAGDAGACERAADAVGPEHTATFLAYAERMASQAVRERRRDDARLGVLAVGLTWRRCQDVRPALPVLGALYDALRRLGDEAGRTFEQLATVGPADFAPALRDFLTRDDLDEIAEEMGYVAGRDSGGFRYRRTWGAGRIEPEG